MNCYEVLGVAHNAPMAEIKKRYQELVLKLHPDKRPQATPVADTRSQFMAVQSAWETLRRQKADKRASDLGLPTAVEVTPEQTDFEELQSRFVYRCRCGDTVLFEVEAIEEGVDLYECNTCSLMYRLRLGL